MMKLVQFLLIKIFIFQLLNCKENLNVKKFRRFFSNAEQQKEVESKKPQIDFNSQMGNCRACLDECGMEAGEKCTSYYKQVVSFHINNLLQNKIDIKSSLDNGKVYTQGCQKAATENDFKSATVVKLCCIGSEMFQDKTEFKINYIKNEDAEIIEKEDAKVKLARCIMCNSKFQPNFIPQAYKLTTAACPKNYIFSGRIAVTDKQQIVESKIAIGHKESDPNVIEYFKASQQSIIVPYKMTIEHYKDCQFFDTNSKILEDNLQLYLNLFDGYKNDQKKAAAKNGKEAKLDDGNPFNKLKVVPTTLLSYGYNLCCNAIDDHQSQPLCELCTSCDSLTQETIIVFQDQREDANFHLDKSTLFKGDNCSGYYDRTVANSNAISTNVDGSITKNAWKPHPNFKSSISLCCQKIPKYNIKS